MKIQVTKPFLPDFDEYVKYLSGIWKSEWITNHGPLLEELEGRLKDRFNLPHCKVVSNGTLALQLAIKALGLKGEIITTSYSYAATTHAILWEGCQPVFADIDPNTLNIDPERIIPLITENTSAILATHVYGNPCDVEGIAKIAKEYGLRVIYDAAHCFDVEYKGKSLYSYGDISTASFHATKVFHTVEGGALFTDDDEIAYEIFQWHNFGHTSPNSFDRPGINAKMDELRAAMGLALLPGIEDVIEQRRNIYEHYDKQLSFQGFQRPVVDENTKYNYAYYPIIFETTQQRDRVKAALENNNIFPRIYFSPPLNKLTYVKSRQKCPVAERIAEINLCLPIYPGLDLKIINKIDSIING